MKKSKEIQISRMTEPKKTRTTRTPRAKTETAPKRSTRKPKTETLEETTMSMTKALSPKNFLSLIKPNERNERSLEAYQYNLSIVPDSETGEKVLNIEAPNATEDVENFIRSLIRYRDGVLSFNLRTPFPVVQVEGTEEFYLLDGNTRYSILQSLVTQAEAQGIELSANPPVIYLLRVENRNEVNSMLARAAFDYNQAIQFTSFENYLQAAQLIQDYEIRHNRLPSRAEVGELASVSSRISSYFLRFYRGIDRERDLPLIESHKISMQRFVESVLKNTYVGSPTLMDKIRNLLTVALEAGIKDTVLLDAIAYPDTLHEGNYGRTYAPTLPEEVWSTFEAYFDFLTENLAMIPTYEQIFNRLANPVEAESLDTSAATGGAYELDEGYGSATQDADATDATSEGSEANSDEVLAEIPSDTKEQIAIRLSDMMSEQVALPIGSRTAVVAAFEILMDLPTESLEASPEYMAFQQAAAALLATLNRLPGITSDKFRYLARKSGTALPRRAKRTPEASEAPVSETPTDENAIVHDAPIYAEPGSTSTETVPTETTPTEETDSNAATE